MMTPAAMVEEGLLNVREAGAFLAVSRTTIWVLMSAGTLPYTLIGHNRRIPRAALKALAIKGLVVCK